jgi:hypothetical protein
MKLHLLIACLLVGTTGAEEDKTDRLMSDVAKRIQKTLDVQTKANDRTRELHRITQATRETPLVSVDAAALRALADGQKEAMDEMDRIISLLEKVDSAIALLEVCQILHKDMERLHRRLKVGDVGSQTQAIEQDIAEMLKEMIDATTRT